MIQSRVLSIFMYLVVGICSLTFSVFLATQFIKKSHSQDTTTGSTTKGAATVTDAPSAPITAPLAAKNGPSTTSAAGGFLEPYVFDLREGRRNPFRPPHLTEGQANDILLPGTPLERFALDELKLVGIIWDVKAPKAMIIDPQTEVHIISKDDRIGNKRGYVAAIREGEVVVIETTTFSGENTYSTRILRVE